MLDRFVVNGNGKINDLFNLKKKKQITGVNSRLNLNSQVLVLVKSLLRCAAYILILLTVGKIEVLFPKIL